VLRALLLLAQTQDTAVYDGRAKRLNVAIPRVEAAPVVDGRLDEDVWSGAARLTGFSQYQPVDGRSAEEQSEVLVWYAPDAIWFGHPPAGTERTRSDARRRARRRRRAGHQLPGRLPRGGSPR
jgi:hypothetical protein